MRLVFIAVLMFVMIIACSEQEKVAVYVPVKEVGNNLVLDRELVSAGHFNRVQRILDSRGFKFDRTSALKINFRKPISKNLSWEITKEAEASRTEADIKQESYAIRGASQEALQLVYEGKYQEALALVTPLAENGDSVAAFVIGHSYEKQGKMDEAVKWLKKSAEGENPTAILTLHNLYMDGDNGVSKDSVEAMKWLERGGESGNKMMQEQLYFIYASGRADVLPNEDKANFWGKKAFGKKK